MEAVTVRGLEKGVHLGVRMKFGGMGGSGDGVWLGAEKVGKWFRLH